MATSLVKLQRGFWSFLSKQSTVFTSILPQRMLQTLASSESTAVSVGSVKDDEQNEGHVMKRKRKRLQPLPEEDYYKSPSDMKTNLLDFLERRDMHKRENVLSIPLFTTGSIVAVTKADPYVRSRRVRFVGICIAINNRKMGSTFTLRNFIDGQGIEMMYETYSPLIQQIEVLKLERRHQSKLYYLRDKRPSLSTIRSRFQPVKHDPNKPIPVYKRKG